MKSTIFQRFARNKEEPAIAVRLSKKLWTDAVDSVLCQDGKERIAYFLGNKSGDNIFFSRVIIVPDSAYVEQDGAYVKISREWVGENVFRIALENDYDVVADMHSHPFGHGNVAFSYVDDRSDFIKLPHINDVLTGESSKFGSHKKFFGMAFVVDHGSFDARYLSGSNFVSIDRVCLISDASLELLFPTSKKNDITPREYLVRQVDIFGASGQRKISKLKFALCGAGGIGSIVAESLLRLGVESLVIIDNDKLEASNLHRWQGGKPSDVGGFKSSLLEVKLSEEFPHAQVSGVVATVFSEEGVAALRSADIIIGAVDNNVTRVFLSRFAAQYSIPYMDGAAQIVASPRSVASPQYRTVFFVPGITACFDCSPLPLHDKEKTALSYVDPVTYEWIKAKGYLEDSPDEKLVTVYGINLLVAGMMTLQVQNYILGGYGVWAYRSNAVEFENGFSVKFESHADVLSEMIPAQAVPIGHIYSLPNEDCPFCRGRRAGKCDAFDLTYPAVANRAVKMPLADQYL